MGGVSEGQDADEVDHQPGDGDDEEAVGADGGRVEEASQALGEDVERDHGQEEAVHEPGEDLQSVVAENDEFS